MWLPFLPKVKDNSGLVQWFMTAFAKPSTSGGGGEVQLKLV